MDQQLLLLILLVACSVASAALLTRLRRERHEHEDATRESPFAMSSEGSKLCPACTADNLWTDTTCVRCGRRLPDAPAHAW
jgi:hypothetical protein